MEIREFAHPNLFLQAASPFLEAHEAENNLILGLAQQFAAEPPNQPDSAHRPFFAVVEDNRRIVAAALARPPRPLVLSDAPPVAIAMLADWIARKRIELSGAVGPIEPSRLFALAWSKLSRQHILPGRKLRIYKLDRIIAAPSVDGSLVQAQPADMDLLVRWSRDFCAEVGGPPHEDGAHIEQWIAEGRAWLWIHNRPACLAVWSGPTPHGVRISFVYTPPELRRRGYATAAVAALSQRLLSSGRRFCFLFTDLSNPTSNSIYQRIGYTPVADWQEYLFAAPEKQNEPAK